ncbi:MAG: haloacid dehalogenase-like hydrolase [Parachlamydiaceae bacterium]|nr:haloacid dehalogenase-like hydrolase [Parachlamydiaceae bacterium]
MTHIRNLIFLLPIFHFAFICAETDPLPSWNEGPAKSALLKFIKDTTEEKSQAYVPPEKRYAAFDQDGTLWVEQPFYVQLFFTIDRIKSLAVDHPEWQVEEPFKSILEGNQEVLSQLTEPYLEKIISVTHSGMTVDAFHEIVRRWIHTAIHPKFKVPFTALVYQPMLEVLQFFSDHGYKNYIFSGGGQEFIRAYASEVYKIPPERIVGSTAKVKYTYKDGNPTLVKQPDLLFIDDHQGKVENINLFLGQRPGAAFGNSSGDQQMLEWTQAGKGLNLEVLIHHDDAEREYLYGENSKIGQFTEALMEEAKKREWIIVSMKKDWKILFPFQIISSVDSPKIFSR